jgi:hypothetical protein
VRCRLHVLAVSLSRGRGPWHPSYRGLVGPQSLPEQRYLPAVDYHLFSPHPASHIWIESGYAASVLPTHYALNIGFSLFDGMSYKQWVLINRKGRYFNNKFLCLDSMQGCELWRFGEKCCPHLLVDGCSWMLHLIPKRRNIYDPTLI